MTRAVENTQDELKRRHRAAVTVVAGFIVLTLVLSAVAFVGKDFIYRSGDPTLIGALWIAIVLFAVGSLALRRTKFAAMRLQDIAALRGISGLLKTLQATTVQVACLGGAVALMGFIITMLTGDPKDMLRAAGVALIVLLYCYPRRNAWQRVVRGIEQTGDANAPPAKGSVA
jgi:predicted lysophospholipase L1 biosynthesis ABC-type transport system permease subunit